MIATRIFSLFIALIFSGTAFAHDGNSPLKEGFVLGNPQIQSINALSFGPEGILFIGDSRNANIVAMDTQTPLTRGAAESVDLKQIDHKIAAMLGTTADKISIQDMAVNPENKMIYLAIHLEDGTPVLMKSDGLELSLVEMDKVSFTSLDLDNPIAADAEDRRGRSQRMWAISDMVFQDGQLMVSGLSNEEFSSIFRAIPFPFNGKQMYASLEIYHAAHGRYETYAPIKTFMPFELNGKPHLVASYTCTPLVIFPMNEIKAGQHSKGKTVAELGNRNSPLDIISYTKNDKTFLLLANSSRALMKIDPEKVAAYSNYLTEPVKENSATAGVEFISLPYVNVQQLADYNEQSVLMVQRKSNGDLNLQTVDKRRL